MKRKLTFLFTVLLAFLPVFASLASECGPLLIQPQELAQMLEAGTDARFIDLRSEKEYNQMHIPGFELLEYSEESVLALAASPQPLVFICASGIRSAMAYNLLAREGRDDVYACVFGVADYAVFAREEQMEGAEICLPCLLLMEEEN